MFYIHLFCIFVSRLVIKTNYDVVLLVAVVYELTVCVLNVAVCARQPCVCNKV